MTSPQLSIIMSVFNDKDRITRCLDSLKNQSIKDFEVIIINDQSTDGSDFILQNYCNQQSNFFYFEGEKKGAYPCRNQALGLCKGTYIGFMDSDDWIEPNMFQSLINSCIKYKADSAMCSVKRFNEETKDITNHFKAEKFPDHFKMTDSYLHRISGGTTHKVFLRQNIEHIKLRFLDYKTSADLEFNWRYFISYPHVAVSKDTHYTYTIRKNSLVTGKHGIQGLDIILVFSKIKQLLISTGNYKKYKNSFLTVAIARLQERFKKESDHKAQFILMIFKYLELQFVLSAFLFLVKKKYSPLRKTLSSHLGRLKKIRFLLSNPEKGWRKILSKINHITAPYAPVIEPSIIPSYFDKKTLTNMFIGYHPDSYIAHNAHPEFDILFDKFIYQNELNNGGDTVRLWSFILNIKQILAENIEGDFAELGVWRGNTASVLAYYAHLGDRKTFLFDTYTGFDEKDLKGLDSHRKIGKFSNTSIELVKKTINMEHYSCNIISGYFPHSITEDHKSRRYAVVSLDCDLYEPMKEGLNFFYPRLSHGGILLLHDYSSFYWEGAKQAINEFCSQHNEYVILIPDKSGSAFIRKSQSV
jgi:glycosyltransferase involved in cell wall biosynthesis